MRTIEPITRREFFLAAAGGQEVTVPTPITRSEIYLAALSDENIAPPTAVSLFTRVLIPEPSIIPVWEQPTSTNAYMTGDRVYYPTAQDDVYESLIDNNVWSPTAYPQGWKVIEV